jgi:hypothetical protein
MADENTAIHIKIEGLDKLEKKFDELKDEIKDTWQAAGEESANLILDTRGLRSYPMETDANMPPVPYYIRGTGMQISESKNTGSSEVLGKQFYVRSRPASWATVIGNRASYAKHVIGQKQAKAMARIGWRKLFDVALSKQKEITEIYQAWINRLLKKVGLN